VTGDDGADEPEAEAPGEAEDGFGMEPGIEGSAEESGLLSVGSPTPPGAEAAGRPTLPQPAVRAPTTAMAEAVRRSGCTDGSLSGRIDAGRADKAERAASTYPGTGG